MDPRHPEVALTRIDQLVNQFKGIIDKINTETVSNRLGQLEREGGLVVQEICLVAPRLHEAMMQASRQRRTKLTRGFFPEVSAETLKEPTPEVLETYVEPNQAETVIVEPKPGMMDEATADKILDAVEKVAPVPKKKTTKKKTTKKKKAE